MTAYLLLSIFNSFGLVVFLLGLQGLAFIPLTLAYEAWKRRTLRTVPPFRGTVTVLIPAYNEERTILATIESVLASDWPDMEIIVVNDGSTDGTASVVAPFAADGRVRYIEKPNGGKASALNAGIEASTGEVVIFTDADSVFLPDTVSKMARWFGDPGIDAVCGNDAPLSPSTAIQKFLAVTTHIGTGFVRRALSVMRCLPIITGNLGAIRKSVLREVGGFREIWGEDLEITFRLYRNRKRIIFDPDPKVIAECPGTIGGLWKQRIRWVRSYIKIALLHKDLFFHPAYAPFSMYLPVNFVNMTVVPLLQLVILIVLPWAYMTGHLYFTDTVEVLAFLGVVFFFLIALYSILLDRSPRDIVYLPYGLLILPLSYFYNAVAAYSWFKEIRGAEERWEKIERRSVFATKRTRWEYAAAALLLVLISSGGTWFYMAHIRQGEMPKPAFTLGLSTHFDAWGDWRAAISNILGRPDVRLSGVVGVSAGRPEWAYFKWEGSEKFWSNHQKGAKEDLLEKAASTFRKSGFEVAAFVDIFGPEHIRQNPGTAAVSYDGLVNTEQVSFMELVEGRYGSYILDMVGYMAANYDIDIINLTEMPYYSYSFNPEDLKSYAAFSGRKDWPRTADGLIDRDDPGVWEWRSTLMEGFIKKAAARAHAHGKKLFVDVPVSWTDYTRQGVEAGLDYRRVLKHADAIVVWNYYFLEDLPAKSAEELSRYMAENFPADRYYISLGLWGKDNKVMGPAALGEGIDATLKGGTRRIWVTPDSMVTPEHWKEVLKRLRLPG